MKNLMKPFVFLIIISSSAYTQKQPEAFIPYIPDLPQNVCESDNDERDVFLSKLSLLEAELEVEITPRKKTVENAYKNPNVTFEKDIAKEYNLSDEDINKLKNKKLSKEEKKKIADKILQDKTNMSLAEIENLKKMSKEGKEAWAEAYSTEQMATMEGKQDSMNSVNEKNMDRYNLAKEQSSLAQQIAAADNKFANQIKELDEEDSVARDMLDRRDTLLAHLGDYDGEQYSSKVKEIQQIEYDYCNYMTPKYFSILSARLTTLKSLLSVYARLEKVNADLNQSILNVQNKDFYSPGLMGLEAVGDHVSLLKTAFKYAIYSFPVSRND